MRTKTFFFIFLLFVCFLPAQNSFAQSVTITPKKITYKRPKPLAEYKKSFTVIRPVVKGLNSNLKRKVETAVSYEKNFSFNVREETNDIQWLEEASYKIDYNKNGILGVTLSMSGTGAYPWIGEKSVVVNLKTGERVIPSDVFIKLDELAAIGKKAQQAEIKKALAEIKKENSEDENPGNLFENSDFTVKNLNEFSVSDKGITFLYDYGFPHVIKAFQPEGHYFFNWKQLKPFIRRDGLLAKFIR